MITQNTYLAWNWSKQVFEYTLDLTTVIQTLSTNDFLTQGTPKRILLPKNSKFTITILSLCK